MNDEAIQVFSTSEQNVNSHIISLELEGGHVSSLTPGFLDPSFCSHISICIYAILVLLIVLSLNVSTQI